MDRNALLQHAVESLYEDERLRSNLTDAEASVLLAWGESQVEAVIREAPTGQSETDTRDAVDSGLARVRSAMRQINDLIGERRTLGGPELRARLTGLVSAQGPLSKGLSEQIKQIVAEQKTLNNEELVSRLVRLLSISRRTGTRGASPRSSPGTAGAPPRDLRSEGGRVSAFTVVAVALVVLLVVAVALVVLRYTPSSPASSPTTTPTSTAAGWYEVAFTSPKYPDNPADHTGGLDTKLAAFIDTASASVDMAIYQLDLENVTQAVINAKGRGAVARVVTDIDILEDVKENPSFKRLQAEGITVVAGNPNAIMHDKFVVVDGKATWTGSWNFTVNDTYRYNNNGILVRSPDLARNYTATFEKMWRDQRFGPSRKPGGTTPALSINGTTVESYFAPEDGVAAKIVARLKNAATSIDFMAFSFTDDQIGRTVRDRAAAGARVRGVFETTGSETRFSEFGAMKAAGLDVLQDGNPYLMHHKVFIVDGRTVIVGSFNFSQNAEESNDENLLIIDDQSLAAQFTAEFERVYAQAKNPPKR